MKVKDVMQTEVFTIGQDDLVDRVFFLIHYEKIRHLPVVEGGRVVGIVSDRDLYKAIGPRSGTRAVSSDNSKSALQGVPKRVRHIMRRGVFTVGPDTDIGEAAALMAKRKIGALPVTRSGKLVGIVTSTDLLRVLSRMASRVSKLLDR